MVENTKPARVGDRVYRLLKQYWQIGVGFSVATAFFLISIDRIKNEFIAGPVQGALLVSLLIVTTLWFVAYLHATLNELEILRDYAITVKVVPSNWVPLLIILGIAVCFGTLIASVTNLLIYSGVAILLLIFDSVGFAMVQRAISGAIQNRQHSQVVPIAIIEYYLYRPLLLHHMGMLLGFFVAFVISLISHYEHDTLLRVPAALAVITSILLGEYVMLRWRKQRDKRLS